MERVGLVPVTLMKFADQKREGGWKHAVTERPLVQPVNGSSGDACSGQPCKLRVYGWETCWWCQPRKGFEGRRFNVDMASFAFRWAVTTSHLRTSCFLCEGACSLAILCSVARRKLVKPLLSFLPNSSSPLAQMIFSSFAIPGSSSLF